MSRKILYHLLVTSISIKLLQYVQQTNHSSQDRKACPVYPNYLHQSSDDVVIRRRPCRQTARSTAVLATLATDCRLQVMHTFMHSILTITFCLCLDSLVHHQPQNLCLDSLVHQQPHSLCLDSLVHHQPQSLEH